MSIASTLAQPPQPPLPELRQELRLHRGPDGTRVASWLIYDPIRHRYFEVSREVIYLLERWRAEPAGDFAARCTAELDRNVAVTDVNHVVAFLITNNLVLIPPSGGALDLARQQAKTAQTVTSRLIHNYLFFKVPLFRPARFLSATLPLVAPLYSRAAAISLLAIWIIGLYFASRQWDAFVTTFIDFLSFDGAVTFLITLVVVKSLHELGHAYTATRAGVRVNTMGIAFMVLTPILYTDVTDAWRLRARKDKLAIDAAGIIVELALAGIALFVWAFLPEGPVRSAAFVTTTTSLLTGLAINLNPLMRFDGYYLLADAWRVPNLQSRSNALALWWLREKLFALSHPAPEAFNTNKQTLLIAYAIAALIYRVLLFLGIALVVYHMFFKALGIVLFAIEIIWFIALPIAREIMTWWSMRVEIKSGRRWRATATMTALAIAALVVPWSGTVRVQGVIMAEQDSIVYAPRPGQLLTIDVADGQPIAKGQPLATLTVPDLDHEIKQTSQKIALVESRLSRVAGDEQDRSLRTVLEGELQRNRADLRGLHDEEQRLTVRAPHDGVVRDLDVDLMPAEWLSETMPILRVVTTSVTVARAYISEDDVWRIQAGGAVTFIPEDPLGTRRTGQIVDVVQSGIRMIDLPYLSSVYGGAVQSDRSGSDIRPRSGRHAVRVAIEGAPVDQVARGTLHLTAKPESFAAAIWRRVLQVLVRESSA